MLNDNELRDLARQRTRADLGASPQFHSLGFDEQKSLFQKTYDANYRALSLSAEAMRPGSNSVARALDVPQIDKRNYRNDRIDQAGALVGDFVREVDFPVFVKDLVNGVFQANLQVQAAQTESFIKLMKDATQSVASFINKIDDTASFAYLAENNSDEFSFGEEFDEKGDKVGALYDKEGEKLDPMSDNQLKARVMDAKIQMAKEQRAMLREVLLMGVTRMVVEKGSIKASVLFDFKADESMERKDKTGSKETTTSGGSASVGGGLLESIFGGVRLGGGGSSKKTQISISSAKGQTKTSLAAQLTGSVDLQFRTDYFNLNNFAQMYGPVTGEERLAAGAQPGPPAVQPPVRKP